MLEIEIPKDIRDYKPKFIGSFTGRQVVCIAVIILMALLCKGLQENILGLPKSTYIPVIFLAVPPFLVGWGDPLFGMPAEKYLQTVFVSQFLSKGKRVYESTNYYTLIEKEAENIEENKDSSKKGKTQENKKRKKENLPPELTAYA